MDENVPQEVQLSPGRIDDDGIQHAREYIASVLQTVAFRGQPGIDVSLRLWGADRERGGVHQCAYGVRSVVEGLDDRARINDASVQVALLAIPIESARIRTKTVEEVGQPLLLAS